MSASVVLTRNSSFDALQTFTMPSATISFTCRAAAAASAAGAMRAPPAPASPFATQTSQFASNPAQAMQPNTSGEPAFRVGSELPTAQGTAVKHECGPHSPFHKATKALPTSAIHLATDWEAQDLADQLEDLLVFTRTTHPGPDPQLLVHSPPADALRPAPPASKMHDTGSFAKQQHGVRIQVPGVRSAVAEADSVTPRAVSAEGNGDAGPAPQAQQAVQLSPVAQLAMMEGPSLEEMLRGPRPLREIALEVSRTSCMHPTFSQDLAVPPVLKADAAAAAALQRGVPASATLTEPAAAELAQAGAAVLQCAPLHPIQQSCDQSSCCKPLSRSCATMPLSPTKSNGAMIQLAQLHKGEWHSSPSQDSEVSDWEEDSSCCTNASEDEASDNSMESAFRSRSARSCPSTQRRMGPQPQSLTLVERRTEQQAKTFSEQNLMDGIMTPEGVQRLMQHTSQQAPPPSPVLHTAVAGLQEGEGQGEEGENMMVVTLHPASTIPVPRSFPEYTSLTGRMLAEDHMPCAVMDSQEDPLPSTFAPTCCDTFPFVNPPPGVDSQAWSFDDEGFFRAGDDDLSGDTCLPSSLPALPLISSLPSSPAFSAFLRLLRTSSSEFEASGRVLRLRRYLRADVAPAVLDAVLDALAVNTRVEALYIQNFERGMGDSQLDRLGRVLARGKIWALNVGENFRISRQAWERFCARLPHTAVAHLFVSEAHLEGSDLKGRMRQAIRQNRRSAPPRDPQVVVHVGNMWWNPRLPGAAEQGRTECTGGSAAGTQGVGSKRLSSELEGEYEALCCSPSTRRSGSQRVGFRGSLVAGASRATLLRPLPPRVQLPDLGSATAGAAGTAGAAEPARGNTMVTRARAGVFVGAPVKDLESVEAGVDDDDEDFHVDDETPLSDDDYEDDTHLRHRCLPLRSARRFVPMAVTPARVSRRLIEKSSCGGAHPARAAGTAPASPYHSPAHPPKRLRGGISRESSASLGSEAGSAEDPVRQAAAHTGGAGVAGSKAAPMDTEATSPLETQRAAHAAVAAEGRGSAPANLTAAPSKTVATGGYARKVGAVVGGRGRAAVAKRISGGTARAQRAELKGKSSFWELVDGGFMQPGQYQFTVGTQEVAVTVEEDGGIRYGSSRFRAISKFALVVLRERNPSRQSCDGWKEVAWNGEKLDVLRLRFQQYQRQQARKGGASAACS